MYIYVHMYVGTLGWNFKREYFLKIKIKYMKTILNSFNFTIYIFEEYKLTVNKDEQVVF